MAARQEQYGRAAAIQQEIAARNPQAAATALVAEVATDAEALGGQSPSYYGPAQWPTYTSGTVPAAGASWHRKPITVKDPGAAEQLWVCVQTSGGGYEWLIVGQASS